MKSIFFIITLLFITQTGYAQLRNISASYTNRTLRESELKNFGLTELNYIKDEMQARKGFIFPDANKNKYFSQFSWYKPLPKTEISFNETEQYNIKLIDKSINEVASYINKYNNSSFRCLYPIEISSIFDERKKLYLGIEFDIQTVYSFSDITDSYLLVVTANKDYSVANDQFLGYNFLSILNFQREGNYLLYNWELKDALDHAINEKSLDFLTQYTFIEDLDGDGRIDPILIYRMLDTNGKTSRVKIIIYLDDRVAAGVRIRSSEQSKDLLIQVDPDFYELPVEVKKRVEEQITLMNKDGICKLPKTWKEGIAQKKSLIW